MQYKPISNYNLSSLPFNYKIVLLEFNSIAMKEIWTREAKNTFKENIIYLKSKWTLHEVNSFIEKTLQGIDLIKVNPNIGHYDKIWDAYKLLITPQIYLFYEIDEEHLVLITFWNNYQKPL